jgi:hypothetical protein
MFCFGIDSNRPYVRFTMSGSFQYRADQDGQTFILLSNLPACLIDQNQTNISFLCLIVFLTWYRCLVPSTIGMIPDRQTSISSTYMVISQSRAICLKYLVLTSSLWLYGSVWLVDDKPDCYGIVRLVLFLVDILVHSDGALHRSERVVVAKALPV